MMRRLRILLWLLVLVAAGALAFLLLRQPPASPAAVAPSLNLTLGGPFTLVGADGQPFASASLNGRPYAIFFGFTHCPDVCPTTLARMIRLVPILKLGAIDPNGPNARRHGSRNDLRQGGLAGAARPDDAKQFPGLDLEVDAEDDGIAVRPANADLVDFQPPFGIGQASMYAIGRHAGHDVGQPGQRRPGTGQR